MAVPDTEPEATSGGKGGLIALVLVALFSGLLGAIAQPVVTKLLADEPPTIPGAPTADFETRVIQNGYMLTPYVEVTDVTIDPIHFYRPLNIVDKLKVRPGDTVSFDLRCSLTPNDGNAKLSSLSLIVPTGFKIVQQPHVITTTQREINAPISIPDVLWDWTDSELDTPDTAQATFLATVAADKPAYLTVSWTCGATLPNRKTLPAYSRALFLVQP